MKILIIIISFIISCLFLYYLNINDGKCLYGIKYYSKQKEFHIHHWVYFNIFLILLNIKNIFIINNLTYIFIGIILSDVIFIPKISNLLFGKQLGCSSFKI